MSKNLSNALKRKRQELLDDHIKNEKKKRLELNEDLKEKVKLFKINRVVKEIKIDDKQSVSSDEFNDRDAKEIKTDDKQSDDPNEFNNRDAKDEKIDDNINKLYDDLIEAKRLIGPQNNHPISSYGCLDDLQIITCITKLIYKSEKCNEFACLSGQDVNDDFKLIKICEEMEDTKSFILVMTKMKMMISKLAMAGFD